MDFTNWDKEDIEDLARALGYEGDNNTTNMCVFIRSAAENKRLIKAYKHLINCMKYAKVWGICSGR